MSLQSIALFRLSAIGDVLMYVPTLRALQVAFPDAKITWIISRPAYDLVKNIAGVDFIVIDKPKTLSDFWRFRQTLKAYHFEVLLATQASFRAHLLYPLIKAKRKIGYDKIRAQEGHRWFINESIPFRKNHTVEGFLQFAQYLGADTQKVVWDIPIEPEAAQWVDQYLQAFDRKLGPVVLINAASSKLERCWFSERFIEVIQFLQQHYVAHVILIGGPSPLDKKIADEIVQHVDVHNLVGKTKLVQLFAMVAKADLLICPDTGPSHMAAALGTKVISLHAVTKPEISGPYGQLNHVVNQFPQAKRKYHVHEAKNLDKDWFEKVHHPDVMRLVEVKDVIEKIQTILGY